MCVVLFSSDAHIDWDQSSSINHWGGGGGDCNISHTHIAIDKYVLCVCLLNN